LRTKGGFLRRLHSDTAGNTLAIVGAALIPITAMIGSGLDVSRAYMAKSRLQSACDAASLAARRVMRNDDLTADVVATGRQFFDFNFQQGMYQTEAFEPEITRPDTGLVRVAASTRIPTTIMRLFGFETLPLNVSCDASLNFVNTDVVLVLDVTGSMDDSVSGTRKIEALQDAVMALYDELAPVQAQLESQGLRLRYGIVPYSSTVNVGRLITDVDEDYIRRSTPYQSRVANYSPSYSVTHTNTSTSTEQRTVSSSTECDRYASNRSYPDLDGAVHVSGSPASGTEITVSYSKRDYRSSDKRCRRYVTTTTKTYTNFTGWTYKEVALDTTEYRRPSGSITLGTVAPRTFAGSGELNQAQLGSLGSSADPLNVSWNGCIEERDTVSSITGGSGFSIPSAALDLDINLVPKNEASRWRPMLPQAVYRRATGNTVTNPTWSPSTSSVDRSDTTNWQMNYAASQGFYACPSESRRLQEWTRDELDGYVSSLTPIGGTYHDIGMIWGARLISTGGIFADGCEEYNGMPCNRHVIFMTDGAQTAYCNVYSAYGVERNDRRVGNYSDCHSDGYNSSGVPTNTTTANLLAKHAQRFRMICNATKNMNVSLWVIAFDTGLTSNLTECASNANQASISSNRDDLISRFRQIGNQIGALRLTK